MGRTRYVLRRAVFAVLAAYLVLSLTFAFVAFTPDPNKRLVQFGVAKQGGDATEAAAAYDEARNRDDPVLSRYVDWVVGYTTLQWGRSYTVAGDDGRARVTSLVTDRLEVTLVYALPAVVLSFGVGLLTGLHSGLRHDSLPDRLERLAGYLSYAIPDYLLGTLLLLGMVVFFPHTPKFYAVEEGLWSRYNLLRLSLPMVVLASNLYAVQLRHARTQARTNVTADFVKVARAKGAGARRVARQVARVAVLPLSSLFLGEVLGVLALSAVVVETVFEVPGFGALTVSAVQGRDTPVLLGVAMVTVFVGIAGSFLQDVFAASLDPRLSED